MRLISPCNKFNCAGTPSATGQSASVTLTYYVYLFKAGSGAQVNIRGYSQNYASVTTSSNAITISHTAAPYGGTGAAVISDWVDLSKYKNLTVQFNLTEVGTYMQSNTGITTSNITSYGDITFAASVALTLTGSQTKTIDISSLSGGYFAFGNFVYGTISNIWLEPA